jgi:signal peptidase I
MEKEKIKNVVNKIIKTYVHQPEKAYVKRITKNEIDIVVCENEKITKLSCRTWQDNYFTELVERARLDVYTYYMTEKGEHLYISSQYSWDEQQPDEFKIIEKVISIFYEITNYHERMKQLAMESPDISPGSPRSQLNHEFYNTDWEI